MTVADDSGEEPQREELRIAHAMLSLFQRSDEMRERGFVGDYTDGFTPDAQGEQLPGCPVADDFGHALGDPMEARFAAALQYRPYVPSFKTHSF